MSSRKVVPSFFPRDRPTAVDPAISFSTVILLVLLFRPSYPRGVLVQSSAPAVIGALPFPFRVLFFFVGKHLQDLQQLMYSLYLVSCMRGPRSPSAAQQIHHNTVYTIKNKQKLSKRGLNPPSTKSLGMFLPRCFAVLPVDQRGCFFFSFSSHSTAALWYSIYQ